MASPSLDVDALIRAYEEAHPEVVAAIRAWQAQLEAWRAQAPEPEAPGYWHVVVSAH